MVRAERAEGDEGGGVPEALPGSESRPEELREPRDDGGDREEGFPG